MAKKKYILTLDQGTSSSRAILFNHHQEIAAIEQRETSQLYPQPGWVEQSPEEIWDSQAGVVQLLLRKNRIDAREIAAIGITNQRETTILWDKTTGRPVYNAIIWQDKRTADYCRQVKNSVHSDYITKSTGLIIDSYFSASKIKWILDHVPDARGLAEKGDLLFGTVDTWLIWKLTSGRVHATDTSNASRTLLFNIHTLDWDARLLEIFDIPAAIMPKVVDSSGIVATTRKFDGIEIPLAGIAGDQQAALFGQCCFEPGMIKNTYGTGCFMLMNTGEKPVGSTSGLLTTVAWSINGKTQYALEGSVFIAGAAIKWLRDSLGVISSAAETEAIAQSVESNEGVYFVPAFSGLGAPYWDMYARGTITGLSQGTGFRHIVRATLEALAYQTRDVIEAMVAGSGISLRSLNVDGGAVANNFLLQFQCDLLNCEVLRPEIIETTALGAAFLAGLATGFWQNEDLSINRRIERRFTPSMSVVEREMLYDGWKKAVSRARGNL